MARDAEGLTLRPSRLHAALRRVVDVEEREVGALVASFTYFFFALASWFVLRPMRDTVATLNTAQQLSWIWVGTLTTMLIANAAFSAAVVRYAPRAFIPYAYHVIVVSLLIFYVLMRSVAATPESAAYAWTGRAFYIWTSVFNLFVTSLFWCFMADVFRSEQAKRLFGFIGVGGTLGSIAGSAATASLARWLGPANLLLVSCVLLEIAVLAVLRFPETDAAPLAPPEGGSRGRVRDGGVALGGSVWSGFVHTIRSPYLVGIAVFLGLFTFGSTFLYYEQTAIVRESFADVTSRTEVLARIELAVQVLTVLVQMFFTGRFIRWFGLAVVLGMVPLVSAAGFAALGVSATLATVATLTIARRAGNFALTNPAMEVLFTVVPREDKYKAKSFIETFVYRLGDQAGAWIFTGLISVGLAVTTVAWLAVPVSLAWFTLSIWLARRQARLATELAGAPPANPAVN